MIELKTWYNDYITFIKKEDAYCSGFTKLEKVYAWESHNPSMGDAMREYIENEKDWILNEHWANWSLNRFPNEFSSEIKKVFISKIKDDISLYKLYLKTDNFDAEDINIMREKFRGKLPEIEKLLERHI